MLLIIEKFEEHWPDIKKKVRNSMAFRQSSYSVPLGFLWKWLRNDLADFRKSSLRWLRWSLLSLAIALTDPISK